MDMMADIQTLKDQGKRKIEIRAILGISDTILNRYYYKD